MGTGTTTGEDTIFRALLDDHERQRSLVADLVETHGDTAERREVFDALRRELQAHAAAEERYFYVPLMQSDATQEQARHSVAEHKELDDFVEQLESYDMAAPQWLITARDFADRLVHHLEEEEVDVFPAADEVLSDDETTELAAQYRSDMERHRNEH